MSIEHLLHVKPIVSNIVTWISGGTTALGLISQLNPIVTIVSGTMFCIFMYFHIKKEAFGAIKEKLEVEKLSKHICKKPDCPSRVPEKK